MSVDAEKPSRQTEVARTTDIDPAYTNRLLGLVARLGELADRNPLDPALRDDVRLLGHDVLRLGDALDRIQTGLAILEGAASIDDVAETVPDAQAPRPRARYSHEAIIPGAVDFYAGLIELPSGDLTEKPENAVEIEIIGDFNITIRGRDFTLNRDVVFCINALLARGDEGVSGSWLKEMGFRRETQGISSEKARNAALRVALQKIETMFLRVGIENPVLRQGAALASRYFLNPNLWFTDLRHAAPTDPIDADGLIDELDAIPGARPTETDESEAVGSLHPQRNSLAAIKAFIERGYPGITIGDAELEAAADNPLIQPQHEGDETFYSHYAARKIIKTIVEAAGHTFATPE